MASKLIIFDNDGVVIDSEILIKQALQDIFKPIDLHLDMQWMYQNLQGLKAQDVFSLIQTLTDQPIEAEIYAAKYKSRVFELMETRLKPVFGIFSILDQLNQQKTAYCLATSGTRETVGLMYKITDLHRYFPDDLIFTAEQVKHGKPAPDLFLLAADTMIYAPERCIVIEDSANGIKGAKAARMTAIGFTGASHAPHAGDGYEAQLKEAGADYIAASHEDVLEIIHG